MGTTWRAWWAAVLSLPLRRRIKVVQERKLTPFRVHLKEERGNMSNRNILGEKCLRQVGLEDKKQQ